MCTLRVCRAVGTNVLCALCAACLYRASCLHCACCSLHVSCRVHTPCSVHVLVVMRALSALYRAHHDALRRGQGIQEYWNPSTPCGSKRVRTSLGGRYTSPLPPSTGPRTPKNPSTPCGSGRVRTRLGGRFTSPQPPSTGPRAPKNNKTHVFYDVFSQIWCFGATGGWPRSAGVSHNSM